MSRPRVLSIPPSSAERNPVIASTYRDMDVTEVLWDPDVPLTWTNIYRRRGDFEVIAYHWGLPLRSSREAVATAVGLRLIGKRVIWHVHEVDLSSRYSRGDHYRVGMRFNRTLYSLCDGLVFYSREARSRLEERWGSLNKPHVVGVHPPTRLPVFGGDPKELRRKHGIDENAFVYGFFGAIRPYKNIPDLLHAYTKIRDSGTTLVLAGHFDPHDPLAPCDLESLLRACDRDVHYRLNGIRDESVPVVMAIMDAVVLPYLNAETSGVLYLALEFQRPVVAFDRGVWRECVTPERGVLCDRLVDGLREVRKATFAPAFPELEYRASVEQLNELYAGLT